MRHGWRWLAWLAAASLCAWMISRVPIVTDIAAFLPGPATAEQRLLAEQLRDGVAARLVLAGVTVQAAGDAPRAARVAAALAHRLRADPHFAFVAAGSPQEFERDRRLLFEARYLLSPRVEPGAFTAEGLQAGLQRLQAQLTSAFAPVLRPMAPMDPTGEMLAVVERLSQRPPPLSRHGAWFTADGRTAIVLAQTRAPGFDVDAQQRAVAALQAAFDAARASAGDGAALTLELAGPGVFAVASRERIESDAQRLSLAATVLIAVVLLAVLRSLRFLLLAAVPTASGALAGLAVIAAGFGEIHGITLGFGLTLIGEAADYATYVYLQRAPPQDTQANTRLWRMLALAVLTSAAGFLAMILSGFRGLAQLGLFSLVGIVVAGAVARWLLPAWLPPANPRLPPLSWPPSRPAVMRGLQVTVAALALGSAVQLVARGASAWNDSLASFSPLSPAAGELDARLRGDASLPELRWVIALERPSQEQALQAAEALRPVLEDQRRTGALAAFDSPADLLPSERTQQARRAALPERAALERAFAQAVAGTGFEPQAFTPFLAAVQAARAAPTLARAYYGASALGSRLDAQLVRRDDGPTAVFVTLHGVDPAKAGPLRSAMAAQGAALIDLKGDVEAILAEYRRTAVWAALGGAALIVVLLFVQLRSPAVVARVVVALAAAVLITAGALLVVEGALTLFHLVALLLVAGIGTNYAMFFARLPADAALRRATLGSVLLAAFTSFVAFGLLATSATPVLHMIGATVGFGTVAGVAAGAACAATERPAA